MASSISSSVNMMDSDSDSDGRRSDRDEEMDTFDHEDSTVTTTIPLAHRIFNHSMGSDATNFVPRPIGAHSGFEWIGHHHMPVGRPLRNLGRGSLREGKTATKESSSASVSGGSTMPSPGSSSPAAAMKGVELANNHFIRERPTKAPSPQRQSLGLGTDDLRLSSGGDSDGGSSVAGHAPEKRGVVKRAVTRRGYLLVSQA